MGEGTSSGEGGWEADPAYLAFLAEYGPSQAWPKHRGHRQWLFAVMESVVLRDAEIDFTLLQVLKAGLGQLARLWRMERPHDPMEEKHGPKPRVRARRADRPLWGHEERELDITYK